MQALIEAIRSQGRGIGSEIVKVDSFLNHRLDTGLLFEMGEAFAQRYAGDKPDLVLTVEASGIALALATAHALGDIPVVFAKKAPAANQSGDMAEEKIYSFTHGHECHIRVDLRYIPAGAKVLIVEDEVQTGTSVREMTEIVRALGGHVVGVGCIVDKSGGTLSLDAPFAALYTQRVEHYSHKACPLCEAGIPLDAHG